MFSHPFIPRIARRFLRIRPHTAPRISNRVVPSPPISASASKPTTAALPASAPPPPKPLDPVEDAVANYAYRWETTSPTQPELTKADTAFEKYPAELAWSQAKFRNIVVGTAPEVAFLGRSNVGKSSLLNALMNHKGLAWTSSKPGKTKLISAFNVNRGKILLVDMPGYGHASRTEWGTEIMKYLKERKELRRAFVLIDAKHGPKKMDMLLLQQLGAQGISYQIVLSKIDRLSRKDGSMQRAFESTRRLLEGLPGVSGLGEVLAVAACPAKKVPRQGITNLRWSVLSACGIGAGK